MFHMAVKQVAKLPEGTSEWQEWAAWLEHINERLGWLRMRTWDWPEDEQEGC